MSTTEQRTAETRPNPADASAWTVPGLDLATPDSDRNGLVSHGGRLSAAVDDGPIDVTEELAASKAGDADQVHPIIGAALACLEALQDIRGVSATTLSSREIRLMLLAVVQIAAAVFALRLRLLVAGELQRVQDLNGATTVGAFFAHLAQTRRAEANAQVRLARDLDRRYPLLLDALERGLMSPEHVEVAVKALRKLPKKEVTAEQVQACQRFLVDAARHLAPDQLAVVGRKLWHVIDPDGAERKEGEALEDEEELAKAKAYFKSWRNGDGTTGFRGKLPDLQAGMLIRAIQAFAAPSRRKNPNIPTGQPDDVRHPKPKPGTAGSGPSGNEQPGGDDRSEDYEDCEGCEAHEDCRGRKGCQGRKDCEGEPGPESDVPYPVRLGHALMELIERCPIDQLDRSSGNNATIVVTMTLDQLLTGIGVATLDDGTETSAGQARRLACEAGIIPLVLGGKSEPLDVGQEQRFHTRHQRAAIKAIDKECAIVGCGRPASQCQVHHPIPYSEGGRTSVKNGAPLCPYHHGLVHSERWAVTWHHRKAHLTRVKGKP